MLVLESIEQEKWYTVVEVSQMVGWSEDVVRRWIERGFIEAFVQPGVRNRRKRVYRSVRIQGCEIVRFMKAHLTRTNEGRVSVNYRAWAR